MSLAFPAWRTYVEVSDCSVLTMPIPALHFTFKNNKKPKQSNKQISKSSLSSVVAAVRVCVCVQVCTQAAVKSKSENLFTGKKLFWRVFFFFFSHLPLLGKPPSLMLGATDSPSPVLCHTHRALSYSTGTKEIQTSAVQHEIHKTSFLSVSRTWLVTADCKWSPEAVEKGWERFYLVSQGRGRQCYLEWCRSQALQGPADLQEGESIGNPIATKVAEADGENPYWFPLGLLASYFSMNIHSNRNEASPPAPSSPVFASFGEELSSAQLWALGLVMGICIFLTVVPTVPVVRGWLSMAKCSGAMNLVIC